LVFATITRRIAPACVPMPPCGAARAGS